MNFAIIIGIVLFIIGVAIAIKFSGDDTPAPLAFGGVMAIAGVIVFAFGLMAHDGQRFGDDVASIGKRANMTVLSESYSSGDGKGHATLQRGQCTVSFTGKPGNYHLDAEPRTTHDGDSLADRLLELCPGT